MALIGMIAAFLALLPGGQLLAQNFVYETAQELSTTGDFDGDGLEDVLVVDRETGYYRLGYGDAGSQLIWSDVRASGVEAVQGLTVGRLINPAYDAFAITSPSNNRVHIIAADDRNVTGIPQQAYLDGTGPNALLAADLGGSSLDDLLIGSVWNDLPNTSQIHDLQNTGSSFTTLANHNIDPPARANKVLLQSGGTWDHAALILRGSGSDSIRLYDITGGFNPATPTASLGGLPQDVDYTYGFFNGGSHPHFVFFVPGTASIRVRPILPSGPNYNFGAETVYAVPNPIDTIYTLPNPGNPDRLIILFNQGATASVYNFSGGAAPSLLQNLSPVTLGDRFIGAPARSNGQIVLLNADQDGTRTANAQVLSNSGASYTATQSWELPPANPGVAAATVLLFNGEPFVDANANLVRAMQAGQWSTDIDLSGSNVQTTTETYQGSSDGLGNPVSINLGAKMAGENHSLPSQYSGNIAIHSFVGAGGVRLPDFSIAPAGGNFDQAVQVDFQPTPPTSPATLFYRINGGAWTAYTGPFYLFQDASVDYYALVSGQQTIVRHADYHFLFNADQLDSDADGIPDYVEIASNLDPDGGIDSDGDGFSDLEELILGSDPTDDGDTPNGWTPNDGTPRPTIEQEASFNLEVTPRPYDGTVPGQAYAGVNQKVAAYDLIGTQMGSGTTGYDPNSFAGLQLWLRADRLEYADGQQVKTWPDSSNFSRRVSQGILNRRPVYKINAIDGQSVVRFDGNDLLLTDDTFSLDDFTIYVVFKDDANLRPSERLIDHDRANGLWLGRTHSAAHQWGGGVKQGSAPYGVFGTFSGGSAHTMTAMRAGTNHTIYRNGVQVATQSVATTPTSSEKIAIGGKVDETNSSEWLNGDIAEVLVYDRALSSAEREKLDEHFAAKYGATTPKAYLTDLSLAGNNRLFAVGTETHYTIETSHADKRLGREMVKLLPLPPQTPIQVSYSYSGGTLATEASAWIADAQATYLGFAQTTVTEEIDHLDTLVTLLMERRLAGILLARGEVTSKYITLFPARPLDQARIQLNESQLLALRDGKAGVDSGFRLETMLSEIEDLVANSSDPGILQLKTIATGIYDISSRLNNVPPRLYRLPIDVLRDFIQDGTMDDKYTAEAGFTHSQLDSALQGAQTIMTAVGDRPVETFQLRLTPSSLTGPCTTLETTDAVPVAKSLFNSEDQPYDMLKAGNFALIPDVVFDVTAYTDSTAAACSGEDVLEVISIQISELPTPPPPPKRQVEKPQRAPMVVYRNEFTLSGERPSAEPAEPSQPVSAAPPAFRTHVEVLGEEAFEVVGDWWQDDTSIVAEHGRGKASFEMTTGESDMFRLEIEGNGDQDGQQRFLLRVHLDGEYLGRFPLVSMDAEPGFIHIETPWLPAKKHRVDLFWDDTYRSDPLQIRALRLQQRTGPDSDGDGIKDWVAKKLYEDNDIDIAPARSATSPVSIEGRGKYLSMMHISGDVRPQPGPNGTWSAQVPLSPFEATDIDVYFQNGILRETRSVVWEPTNVLNAGTMHLRKGDALLLTAETDAIQKGQVQLFIGEEVFRGKVGEPIVYRFDHPGSFKVEGACISEQGSVRKGQFDVKVYDTEIAQSPAVWVGNTRRWDVPEFGQHVTLEADEDLILHEAAYLPKGGRRLNLAMQQPETKYLLARIAETGAVLTSIPVQGFDVKTAVDTYVRLVKTHEDGSQLVSVGFIASPVPKNVSLKLTIFVGGVTFEDGTISKTLTAVDFDALGRCEVRFNRAAGSKTAVCHITEAYQGYQFVGTVAQLREAEE